MEHIKIDHVCKYFSDNKVLDDINIHIKQGEFFTLLGPSGCGKTTLLRALAGFHIQEEGDISFGEKNVNNIPAHKRNIGMVFQNYAIFPHLTVFDNVAYGLKARKIKKEDIKTRVNEALEMVELGHLGDRQPAQLSGGQQQRVALARAIVIHPGLLLMDEPLSNLDAKLRVKMRDDIKALQNQLDITTIYVTHDQEEALAVSDRIAVLNAGKVQQIGKPYEIYLNPANKFVANFIGSTNFIDANIENGFIHIENIQLEKDRIQNYKGKATYSIRPEQINLKVIDELTTGRDLIGTIEDSTFLGQAVFYKVTLENGQTLHVNEHAVTYNDLRSHGEQVAIDLNPQDAVIFDEAGGEVIHGHEHSNTEKTQTV